MTMADTIPPELAARIADELARWGQLLPATALEVEKAKLGLTKFDLQVNLINKTFMTLYNTTMAYNKAMYDGQRGLQAMNSSVDAVADGLQAIAAVVVVFSKLNPALKLATAALGFMTGEAIKASKVFGEQGDNLRKGFEGLAEIGATAGEGMQGVFDSLQKLGLGVKEADDLVRQLGSHSQEVAMFGGTMLRGRKRFEDTVKELEPFRDVMLSYGLNQKQQNEQALKLTAIQNRLNIVTEKNAKVSGEAVEKYVAEMDQLTRITGLNRKQQQDLVDEAMREQMYAATRDRVAREKGQEAAEMMDRGLAIAARIGPTALKGYKDSMSGFVSATDEAGKLTIASNSENMRLTEKLRSGEIKTVEQLAEAFQPLVHQIRITKDAYGEQLASMGNNDDAFLAYNEQVNAAGLDLQKMADAARNAKNEQDDQTGKAGKRDELLAEYNKLLIKQQKDMLKVQADVQRGVLNYTKTMVGASSALGGLTDAARKAAEALGIIGGSKENTTPAPAPQQRLNQAQQGISAQVATNESQRLSPQEARNVLENGTERDIAAFGGRAYLSQIAASGTPDTRETPPSIPTAPAVAPGGPGSAESAATAQARQSREQAEAAQAAARANRERIEAEQGRASQDAKEARVNEMKARQEAERARAAEEHRRRQQGQASVMGGGARDISREVGLVTGALKRRGETDLNMLAAVLGNVNKETGFNLRSEESYKNTSNDRIRTVFGSRATGMSDQELTNLKQDDKAFFERMYGTSWKVARKNAAGQQEMVNPLGNTEVGDGWKFRGRGFIQLTGRANYAAASKAIFGDDRLLKNPDLANDPNVAAEVTAWFTERGKAGMAQQLGIDVKNMTPEQASRLATSIIAGRPIKAGDTSYTGTENFKKAQEGAKLFESSGRYGALVAQTQASQVPVMLQSGTMGTLGKLFADFGSGTPAILHGEEAVVTKKQFEQLVGQITGLASSRTKLPDLDIDGVKTGIPSASDKPNIAQEIATALQNLNTAAKPDERASNEMQTQLLEAVQAMVTAQKEMTDATNRLLAASS